MSQGKLAFKTTKQKRQNVKQLDLITNDKVESLKSADKLSSGNKRKHVSSPESSSPVDPPRTGYTRAKRQEKRVRHTRTTRAASKTLLDYLSTELVKSELSGDETACEEPVQSQPVVQSNSKEEKKGEEKDTNEKEETREKEPNEKEDIVETPQIEAAESSKSNETSEPESVINPPVESEDKSTQNDDALFCAKAFLKKVTQPREEPVKNSKCYKTNGAKMLAAALAKKKEGVAAHKNEAIRALAARRELATNKTDHVISLPIQDKSLPTKFSCQATNSRTVTISQVKPSDPAPAPSKLSARARFAHLLKPTSPKIKPFKAITVNSPTKSPAKEQAAPGLTLPETYKSLHSKFGTSDQVVNLMTRRQETCTFQKLQKNVQEISRKRFTEGELAHVHGLYPEAYILAQSKGLSQIKNDRAIRNEYQLTIAFNYAETEDIKRSQTTNIFSLHPTVSATRKLDFKEEVDSNKMSENDKLTLDTAKDRHAFNQRGLVVAELLERGRRFQNKLLKYVRAAHQIFMGTLVPALKIDDDKLVRWHPGFDLNGLELPPSGDLPQPPVSTRILSVTEMLVSIDSNKASPPPGMQKAVEKNLEKVLAEKQDQLEKDAQDKLKGLDPALVARIRAKEANRIAHKMTRDPQKDTECAMLERLEPVVRCLRVMYVSAGKGSLPLSEVTLHISTNPRVTFSQHSVEEHIRLLMTISPKWLSVANLRKKEYLKLNRNFDTNIVLKDIQNRLNEVNS